MSARSFLADIDAPSQLNALTEWLSRWDPCLSIEAPQREAILYEPDGTLYAIALGEPMTTDLYHRPRTIRCGDAIVVPRGLAIEFVPEVDLLAIRSTGTPPRHFRERFVRVWGFEHFPAQLQEGTETMAEIRPVVAETDLRFPFHYTLWNPRVIPEGETWRGSETLMSVLVNLRADTVPVALQETGKVVALPHRHLLAVWPGEGFRALAAGCLAWIRLATEPHHVARDFLDRAAGQKTHTD